MRFSRSFIPTKKEPPSEAVLLSHKYLIQAGFISTTGSGIYNFLPLGKKILDQITSIVKEELNNSGAMEVELGMVTPASLWKQSGRYEQYGKELLRFKDRKNNDFVLGPTYEEAMVDLLRNRVTSYKNLPLNIYQVKTKFRDEIRPRFGLLRGREFLMKDGYSFHSSIEDMQREFALMQKVYSNILRRLNLDFRIVDADSGSIGGSSSKEFMVLAPLGEDDIVVCSGCEYAANIEAAVSLDDDNIVDLNLQGKIHTPNITTIDALVKFLDIPIQNTIKALVRKVFYDDKDEVVVFLIRGDDELQETKALRVLNAISMNEASSEDLASVGLKAGFIGVNSGCKTIVDNKLKEAKNLVCGANEIDYHEAGIYMDESYTYADLKEVKCGDLCLKCGEKLNITKGIEVGHVFELGTKYSSAMDAKFLDENGKSVPFIMGTYGMGISRLMAVLAEVSSDEKGCIWSENISPYKLDIIISDIKKKDQVEFANSLYEDSIKHGIDTILDDRKDRFGSKMRDFELIGFPYAVIVGRNLNDGLVQMVDRKTLEKTDINSDEILNFLVEKFA